MNDQLCPTNFMRRPKQRLIFAKYFRTGGNQHRLDTTLINEEINDRLAGRIIAITLAEINK